MPPYDRDYRDFCTESCCNPQVLYRPGDIETGSELYHRNHAKIGQLAGWNSPPTVQALRQRSGSWGYLSPRDHIAFDESGHVWIRQDAELRPAPQGAADFNADYMALVFWVNYNNVGLYLNPLTFKYIQQRNVSSLKNQECASATGVTWTPVTKLVAEVPSGLVGFSY